MKAQKSIRMTVNEAASECGVHRATLTKRLKSAGIQPDQSGRYTIRQIVECHGGDYHGLRNEKLKVETQLARLELEQRRDELWPREYLAHLVTAYFQTQRSYLFRLPGMLAQRLNPSMQPSEVDRVAYDIFCELLVELRESGHLALLRCKHGKLSQLFLNEYLKTYATDETAKPSDQNPEKLPRDIREVRSAKAEKAKPTAG